MPTRKDLTSLFQPDDDIKRRNLNAAITQLRERWYGLDVQRKSQLRVLAAARAGGSENVPAVAHMPNAADQLKSLVDGQVAQTLTNMQSIEAEILTYLEELAQLPQETSSEEPTPIRAIPFGETVIPEPEPGSDPEA